MGTAKVHETFAHNNALFIMEHDIPLQLPYNACTNSPSCNDTDSSTTLKLLETRFFALYLASAELLCPAVTLA